MSAPPQPVAIAVVPVLLPDRRNPKGCSIGVVAIRRRVAPALGKLALPGGYIDAGETWQAAAARELAEEAHILLAPEELRLIDVRSSQDASKLLVFGMCAPLGTADLPEGPVVNAEVSELVLVTDFAALHWAAHRDLALTAMRITTRMRATAMPCRWRHDLPDPR